MARMRYSKGLIILSALFLFLPLVYFLSVPDVSKLGKERPRETALMEYREKEARQKGKKYSIQRTWVPFSSISPYLIKVVLIAEDDKFWRHEGFDYEAIEKAIEKDMKARRFRFGGSTISQQLARNLYLSPVKNPLRKMREAIITWRMEKVLSKRRILELYLNLVEWGDGIFGIEAASRHYYGKPSSELSPEEAARLASVLPNPRRYNPLGSQRYVVNRSTIIYRVMIQRGIVPPEYKEVTEKSESTLEGLNPIPSMPAEKPTLSF